MDIFFLQKYCILQYVSDSATAKYGDTVLLIVEVVFGVIFKHFYAMSKFSYARGLTLKTACFRVGFSGMKACTKLCRKFTYKKASEVIFPFVIPTVVIVARFGYN